MKCVVATRHSLVSPPYDRAAEAKFSLIARRFVDAVVGICGVTCDNLRGAPRATEERARRAFGERARSAYEEHFTLAQMAAAYEAIYR